MLQSPPSPILKDKASFESRLTSDDMTPLRFRILKESVLLHRVSSRLTDATTKLDQARRADDVPMVQELERAMRVLDKAFARHIDTLKALWMEQDDHTARAERAAGERGLVCRMRCERLAEWLSFRVFWRRGAEIYTDKPVPFSAVRGAIIVPFTEGCP
jgi:hypothetical protein